jgi:hypothetical protein
MKKYLLMRMVAVSGAFGLLSCAAEKAKAPSVHSAVDFALWTSAQMPAVEGEQWSPYHSYPESQGVLLSIAAKSSEILPFEDDDDDGETDFPRYFKDFIGPISGASGSSGGSSTGATSGGRASLPTSPSIGQGSLPTRPSALTAALSPSPAFMRSFGGGAAASGDSFAHAICSLIAAMFTYSERCLELESATDNAQIFLRACKAEFATAIEEAYPGVSFPASVVNGVQCVADALLLTDSCDNVAGIIPAAYSKCGIIPAE